MAKRQQNKEDERSVDMNALEPALKKKAHDLGFRQRVSINKILRGIEHEKWAWKLCMGFVVVMAVAAMGFLIGMTVVHEDRRGHFLGIGVFAAFWSAGAYIYSKRAIRRQEWSDELLVVVKDKLGK